AAVILCTGFFAFMIFAFRKTTPRKGIGFWRETLRPFMISLSLFGIGATTTAIAREWNHCEFRPSSLEGIDNELDSDIPTVVATKTAVRKIVRDLRDRYQVPESDGLTACRPCLDDEGRAALVSG